MLNIKEFANAYLQNVKGKTSAAKIELFEGSYNSLNKKLSAANLITYTEKANGIFSERKRESNLKE